MTLTPENNDKNFSPQIKEKINRNNLENDFSALER